VTDILVDASVALKWFHRKGEPEVDDARRLLRAHRTGALRATVLDLTLYEVGNAGIGKVGWSAHHASLIVRALREGPSVAAPAPEDWQLAAGLAHEHQLTVYDAMYPAVARRNGSTLVTLDNRLLTLPEAAAPSAVVAAHQLEGTVG
jgi:predicted nucleic acid-binding protein